MKLTVEEINGQATEFENIRHISITDTERVADFWYEEQGGQRFTFEKPYKKPARMILEFGDPNGEVSYDAEGLD